MSSPACGTGCRTPRKSFSFSNVAAPMVAERCSGCVARVSGGTGTAVHLADARSAGARGDGPTVATSKVPRVVSTTAITNGPSVDVELRLRDGSR